MFQIGTKITENGRLRKQAEAAQQDHEQLKADVQLKDEQVAQLQTDVEHSRQVALARQVEVSNLEARSHALEHELERVKQELADNLARSPLLMEQIQVQQLTFHSFPPLETGTLSRVVFQVYDQLSGHWKKDGPSHPWQQGTL